MSAIGLALVALYVAVYAARNVHLQWDLRTYLVAARAALSGLDPYVTENLAAMAARPVVPFVYPLPSLLVFMPLSGVSASAVLWMFMKVGLLAGSLLVWRRVFLRHTPLLALALLAVFGWNGTALWDLRTGNVALIECATLTAAFAFFVSGRRAAFSVFVVAAACFKLFPAFFLLLLLVPANGLKPSPRYFAIALAALAILVLAPMWVGPAAGWSPFFSHIPAGNTLGETNPSALGLIIVALLLAGVGEPLASQLAIALWAGGVVAVLAFSVPWFRRAWQRRDPRLWVMGAAFIYVLLLPRPMAYGFTLLAPAVLFFSPAPFDRAAGRWMLVLILCAQGLTRAAQHGSDSYIYMYAPFMLALCVWLLVARAAREAPTSCSPAS